MEPGTAVRLNLLRGNELPCFPTPSCSTRFDGSMVPNGATGIVIGPADWLNEPEYEAEWVIVQFGEKSFAPAEIHDHLGVE